MHTFKSHMRIIVVNVMYVLLFGGTLFGTSCGAILEDDDKTGNHEPGCPPLLVVIIKEVNPPLVIKGSKGFHQSIDPVLVHVLEDGG
jgi:hypothetical protein